MCGRLRKRTCELSGLLNDAILHGLGMSEKDIKAVLVLMDGMHLHLL